MRESIFSFWQDPDFNALEDKPPAAGEDGLRPDPGRAGEESWVFEAFTTRPYHLRVSFTLSTSAAGTASLLRICWYGDGGTVHETWPGPEAAPSAGAGNGGLSAGPNRVHFESGKYLLRLETDNIAGELEWEPLVPGWQPGAGRLAFGDQGRLQLFWRVPVPRAAVRGRITIDGKDYALEGLGYHDYRRYNFPLGQALAGICLGRFYHDQYTLLFADFGGNLLYSGKHVAALYLVGEKGTLISTPHVETNPAGQSSSPPKEVRAAAHPPVYLVLDPPLNLWQEELKGGLAAGSLRMWLASGRLRLATDPEREVRVWGRVENLTVTG
ncbi:MAG: hypothetical protein IMW96_11220 [Thermoanaerobacteraceae bacterium]|nr:hypothetical protein [Thermoanaerobacteraceae bacterium]